MMMNHYKEASDIDVFVMRLLNPLDDGIFELFMRAVDDEKKKEISAVKNKAVRDMKIVSRIFSGACIKKTFGINLKEQDFGYEEFGKPCLVNFPDIHFNVSHSNGVFVCAVGNAIVGVDVEKIRDFSEKLILKTCNEEESKRVFESSDKDTEFCKIWTRKEAYLKFIGTGIQSFNLKNVLNSCDASIKTTVWGDYVISVAVKNELQLLGWNFTDDKRRE